MKAMTFAAAAAAAVRDVLIVLLLTKLPSPPLSTQL